MVQVKSIPWGNTQIKFLPGDMAEKDVRKAASLVSPSFVKLTDTVALTSNNGNIISTIVKPEHKQFLVSIASVNKPTERIQEAMRLALEKVANFLKGRA